MIALPEAEAHDSTLASLAVDLAPLLDTFFILLVFFMLTTGDVVQSLAIELPAAAAEDTAAARDRGRILLEIGESAYALDGRPVADFDALAVAVAERASSIENHGLVIASDRRATVARLLKVLAHLQSEGIEVADLLMRPETAGR